MSARAALLAVLAAVALLAPAVAVAERPATPRELAAINRLLGPSASSPD
jgi:hypothetical protein